jgi:copper(I)-binding protein
MSRPRSGSSALVVVLVVVALALVGVGLVVATGGGGGGEDDDADAAADVEGVVVRDAWTGPNQSVTAVYFMILNGGAEDRLVGATADVGATALLMDTGEDAAHASADGAARVDLAVPPGTTELAPGGRHLMLTDLSRPLEPDDELRLQLTFEQAGAVEVPVEVVSWDEVAERGA